LDIRRAIKTGEIRPVKSLGQNFLADANVAERIVDAAGVRGEDVVIEIGPGAGALTEKLCHRAGFVVAVEIDRRLVETLEPKMALHGNFKLINGDILKLGIPDILAAAGRPATDGFIVISNLPYYITTPIIMGVLEGSAIPFRMVLMMQKEVADRIVARPSTKAYGALTVAVNYYAKPTKAFSVPPHCFVPQPGVDSTVLVLEPHGRPPVDLADKQFFFRVVRAAFAQRRKQLINCLIHEGLLPKDKALAGRILEGAGLSPKARGDELGITEFARLSNKIRAEMPEMPEHS